MARRFRSVAEPDWEQPLRVELTRWSDRPAMTANCAFKPDIAELGPRRRKRVRRDVQRSSLVSRSSVFRRSQGRAALTTKGITIQVRITTTPALINPASTNWGTFGPSVGATIVRNRSSSVIKVFIPSIL
jgi:hypothetical protein